MLEKGEGKWDDWEHLTFPAIPDREKHQYFWTYESLYRSLDVPLPEFDKASMDAKFGGFKHLNQDSTFKDDEWEDYLSRMFRIEDGYTLWPAAVGERLYDRPADGYTFIPVSHLKAGLRLLFTSSWRISSATIFVVRYRSLPPTQSGAFFGSLLAVMPRKSNLPSRHSSICST